jgi:deoxyribodipyrimidine photo-lyase
MNKSLFWFRRDLRLEDNAGLFYALKSGVVQPCFIFDKNILKNLPPDDIRVNFIYQQIKQLKKQLNELNSDLQVVYSTPEEFFTNLLPSDYSQVFTNEDYEPLAIKRDEKINSILSEKNIKFNRFKDQVIFNPLEILNQSQKPYTIYSHYNKKWKSLLTEFYISSYPNDKYFINFKKQVSVQKLISLAEMGFQERLINYPNKELNLEILKEYKDLRNYPSLNHTSKLSVHLRFGTISIRKLVQEALAYESWIDELIWREFFMNLIYHFPQTTKNSFKSDFIFPYENNPDFIKAWQEGNTGVALVDAGMRELNSTGLMHNRVRMVVASFLCKNLLVDWKIGEQYFAQKLLDFDLSANIGNWQWVAGSGCDAQPFFRIFNPITQQEKFDPDLNYIKKWVPEYLSPNYKPIINIEDSRKKALEVYSSIKKSL